MSLKIYDYKSKQIKEFTSLVPGKVTLYTCGPTVYDFLHVGNFRGAIFYNLVRSWLEKKGYQVNHVYNYTDVDDKIIIKAQKENTDALSVSQKFIEEFEKDFSKLGLKKHTSNPKVSDFIPQIIAMIEKLIQNNHAYVEQGEVLYSVKSFETYGSLSHRKVDDLRSGARVEIGDYKRDPLDFSLWKPAKPGEPSWPSPWGKGRPGWHIECSAMIQSLLGDEIDIHGGGMDLVFPHHENEIAQSEGCSHKNFVRFWMHHNLLQFSGAKMSKSLGNIITCREFINQYHPEILKYMHLFPHYRSVSDFSQDTIHYAIHGLSRIYSSLSVAYDALSLDKEVILKFKITDQSVLKYKDDTLKKIYESLDDDFNTPQVFAALFELVRYFNDKVKRGLKLSETSKQLSIVLIQVFHEISDLTALFSEKPSEFLKFLDDMLLSKMNIKREDIEALIQQRKNARSDKNFAESDRIRDELNKLGIAVSDTAAGMYWEVKK